MKCAICENLCGFEPILKYEGLPDRAQYFPNNAISNKSKLQNLNVYQCRKCNLVQLDTSIAPFYYRTAINTASLYTDPVRKQFLSEFVKQYKLHDKTLLDIGSGLNVSDCLKAGFKSYTGIPGIADDYYIDASDAFVCCNYFEHYPDPVHFLQKVKELTFKSALGIIEVPNFDMILEKKLFAEITSDHLFYFTKKTLEFALSFNGFEVLQIKEIKDRYILSAVVRRKKLLDLRDFDKQRKTIKSLLYGEIAEYNTYAIWGAGHQSLAIMSLVPLLPKYVIDDAPFKQGKYTPGTNTLVVSSDELKSNPVEAIVIIAGSYSDQIVSKIIEKKMFNGDIFVLRPDRVEKIR